MPSTYHALAFGSSLQKETKNREFLKSTVFIIYDDPTSFKPSPTSLVGPTFSSTHSSVATSFSSASIIKCSKGKSLHSGREDNEDSKLELLKIEALCRSRSVLNDGDDTFTVVASTATTSLPKKRN
ncbi:Hypothetical predicted protein [Olea europaea subsp. europaea]|uniref:Uncharacterized protein n=1 Tax=Olea europaea subsp. europaea TaxID=158383 RepID=A0A8S0RKU2_OLEEU|nr:Hypothetical predicted protein [Olea europaea subsp. europaea]